MLTVTLASNFGTFLLYMLSCITCIVSYHKHPKFKFVRHLLIPVFGLLANLACMAFYVIGPFMGYGTKMEPLLALGVALVWGIYGGIYFFRVSKSSGRTTLVQDRMTYSCVTQDVFEHCEVTRDAWQPQSCQASVIAWQYSVQI